MPQYCIFKLFFRSVLIYSVILSLYLILTSTNLKKILNGELIRFFGLLIIVNINCKERSNNAENKLLKGMRYIEPIVLIKQIFW